MKEELKEICFSGIPTDRDACAEAVLQQIATPEGAAAAFILALLVFVRDPALGRACLDMICLEPPDEAEIGNHFTPMAQKHPEIPRSYVKDALPENGYRLPEGALTVRVKVTNERALRRGAKTVYVGCNGTATYRPVTLVSRPPRFVWKRFGVKRAYETDPWFVSDYPSLLLPVMNPLARPDLH